MEVLVRLWPSRPILRVKISSRKLFPKKSCWLSAFARTLSPCLLLATQTPVICYLPLWLAASLPALYIPLALGNACNMERFCILDKNQSSSKMWSEIEMKGYRRKKLECHWHIVIIKWTLFNLVKIMRLEKCAWKDKPFHNLYIKQHPTWIWVDLCMILLILWIQK